MSRLKKFFFGILLTDLAKKREKKRKIKLTSPEYKTPTHFSNVRNNYLQSNMLNLSTIG